VDGAMVGMDDFARDVKADTKTSLACMTNRVFLCKAHDWFKNGLYSFSIYRGAFVFYSRDDLV
jgi:hypothetical protein